MSQAIKLVSFLACARVRSLEEKSLFYAVRPVGGFEGCSILTAKKKNSRGKSVGGLAFSLPVGYEYSLPSPHTAYPTVRTPPAGSLEPRPPLTCPVAAGFSPVQKNLFSFSWGTSRFSWCHIWLVCLPFGGLDRLLFPLLRAAWSLDPPTSALRAGNQVCALCLFRQAVLPALALT